jgi:hypothetical protein
MNVSFEALARASAFSRRYECRRAVWLFNDALKERIPGVSDPLGAFKILKSINEMGLASKVLECHPSALKDVTLEK